MAQTKAQLLGPVVGDVIMDVSTLSLDAEGNKVGIGTTEADLTLHVNGVNALPSSSGSTPTGHLTLRAKATSSSHGMFMGVSNAAPWSSWIQAQDANNNATNYPLLLNPNGGNIGIGTDNPAYKLDVQGTGVLTNIKSTNNNYVLQIAGNNCPYDVYLGTDNSNKFLLANENNDGTFTERLCITAAGDMGLGTTTPTSFGPTFQISGADPCLLLQDTATAVDYYGMNIGNGHVTSWFDDSAYFAIGTAAGISGASYAEKLRIDSAGRMGLGIAPSNFGTGRTALEVHSANSTVTHISLTNSTTGSNGASNGFNIIQNGNNALLYLRENGNMTFSTNNTERLLIDSTGNITLGYGGNSLYFQNGFNNSTARIQNGGGSNNSELKFLVRNAGTESEKMRLTSTAGLAVVTTGSMPANAGNETLYIQGEGHSGHGTSNTRSVVSVIGALTSNSNAAGLWVGTRTNENTAVVGTRTASGNLAIETYSGGWGERLRIKSNGYVGINDTNPTRALTIKYNDSTAYSASGYNPSGGAIRIFNEATGSNITAGEIMLGAGNSGTGWAAISCKRPGSQETELNFRVMDSATWNTGLTISKSAFVGIGVDSPAVKLDVKKAAAGPVSRFYDNGSNGGMYYSTGPVMGISRVSNGSISQHGLLFQVGWDKNSSDSFNIDETVLGVGDKGVGVGEDDPQVMLHCSKSLTSTSSYKDTQMIRIAGTTGADTMAGIGFGYYTTNPAGSAYPSLWLGAKVSSWTSYVRHDMIFATRELDTNTEPKERFRIKGNSQFQYSSYRAHKYSDEASATSLYRFRLAINMIGNVSYTIRLGNFGNGAHHVRLMGSHWTSSYQLVKESYYYTDSYAGLSETSVHNITSSAQGSWGVSRPQNGQTGYTTDLIITKSAGSYHGGHVGMIDITTNRDLRLISIT